MTDNEIIKALERCNRPAGQHNCKNCPYYQSKGRCTTNLLNDTIDLINRQQAEIVSLKNKVELLEMEKEMSKKDRDKATAYAMDIIKKQDVEIERLTERNFELAEKGEKVVIAYKTAKAEAIKEFAERLKALDRLDVDVSYGYGREHYTEAIAVNLIDNLVKEMVGENNG
jgi:hypothetical protein